MMLANPDQIKKRVVVQNNLVIKNNFINHKEDPIINVDSFMKTFVENQEKLRTKYTEKIIINKLLNRLTSFFGFTAVIVTDRNSSPSTTCQG